MEGASMRRAHPAIAALVILVAALAGCSTPVSPSAATPSATAETSAIGSTPAAEPVTSEAITGDADHAVRRAWTKPQLHDACTVLRASSTSPDSVTIWNGWTGSEFSWVDADDERYGNAEAWLVTLTGTWSGIGASFGCLISGTPDAPVAVVYDGD